MKLIRFIVAFTALRLLLRRRLLPHPVEFTFYEHSDSEPTARMMADAFNALGNGMKVNVSIIANNDYDDKIKVMLAGGGNVDAFFVRQPGQATQLAANGSILALDDFIKAAKVDLSVYGNMAARRSRRTGRPTA